jgi:hypothetical protein
LCPQLKHIPFIQSSGTAENLLQPTIEALYMTFKHIENVQEAKVEQFDTSSDKPLLLGAGPVDLTSAKQPSATHEAHRRVSMLMHHLMMRSKL